MITKSYTLETLHQGLQIESRSAIKHIMKEGKGKYNGSRGGSPTPRKQI